VILCLFGKNRMLSEFFLQRKFSQILSLAAQEARLGLGARRHGRCYAMQAPLGCVTKQGTQPCVVRRVSKTTSRPALTVPGRFEARSMLQRPHEKHSDQRTQTPRFAFRPRRTFCPPIRSRPGKDGPRTSEIRRADAFGRSRCGGRKISCTSMTPNPGVRSSEP